MARSVHAVEAFVEKPDAATAATYVADGYLWNSGNFLFHAATMLAEIERFEPAMAEAAKAAVAGLTRDLDFLRLAAEPFARAPKKSIDYAVMERTKLAAVVPADHRLVRRRQLERGLGHSRSRRGRQCNRGSVVMLDSRNSLCARRNSVLTTVVGLDDVIVVTTADAVLVSARAKAEQVKTLVEQLKAQNHRAAVEHRRIYRPWGYYQDVDMAPRYQVKRIVVKPGSKLSLQKHFHRSEHWVVVTGNGRGHGRQRRAQRARKRIDLHPDRQRSSARQSRQDPARTDRGAGRQLSRRGRHRAPRRRLRAGIASAPPLFAMGLRNQR